MTLLREYLEALAARQPADEAPKREPSNDSLVTATPRMRFLLCTQADDLDDPDWLSI